MRLPGAAVAALLCPWLLSPCPGRQMEPPDLGDHEIPQQRVARISFRVFRGVCGYVSSAMTGRTSLRAWRFLREIILCDERLALECSVVRVLVLSPADGRAASR